MSGVLTVDPGMNTGWAYWKGLKLEAKGQITIKKKNNAEDIALLSLEFYRLVEELNPDEIVIEYPGVWAGSTASIASAMSGDLIKLAAIVGALSASAGLFGLVLRYVTPQEWKGQLPKEGVALRVRRVFGKEEGTTHINDAIGIGLHLQNRFTERNPDIKAFSNAAKPKVHSLSARKHRKK